MSYLTTTELGRIPELVNRYATNGPRYTSYPPASELSEHYDEGKWIADLGHTRTLSERSLSLYVHVPFCKSLCFFCACNKIITKNHAVVAPYLATLGEELRLLTMKLQTKLPLAQLHWGGGTPNYLSSEELIELFSLCNQAFPRRLAESELSIEVDPRTVDQSQIDTLARLGFNRISMGVQDFEPAVQKAINRQQSIEQTREVFLSARQNGIASVGIDLIYGLPFQELASFAATIDKVLSLRPDRIALYGYAHVSWMAKAQASFSRDDLPSPKDRLTLFLYALEALLAAGYCYIGMDHFALPGDDLALAQGEGRLRRNFMGYTTRLGAYLLGVGPSAISVIPEAMTQNEKDITRWRAKISSCKAPLSRGVRKSSDDHLRGEIIEALLCSGEVSVSELGRRWGERFSELMKEALPKLVPFVEDDLLQLSNDRMILTPLGRLFARTIAMSFDAYLSPHAPTDMPQFSSTV